MRLAYRIQCYTPSPYHVHAGVYEKIVFVPSLDIGFGMQLVGPFGKNRPFVVKDEGVLGKLHEAVEHGNARMASSSLDVESTFELEDAEAGRLWSQFEEAGTAWDAANESWTQLNKAIGE